MFKSIRYSCFGRVHFKFLYNNKFDFTAKSLVTNTVVIPRVLCMKLGPQTLESDALPTALCGPGIPLRIIVEELKAPVPSMPDV